VYKRAIQQALLNIGFSGDLRKIWYEQRLTMQRAAGMQPGKQSITIEEKFP